MECRIIAFIILQALKDLEKYSALGYERGLMNQDTKTVEGFGLEWKAFDQSKLSHDNLADTFNAYFSLFPWQDIGRHSQGFDLGCGSGRWAKCVAPKVGALHCIDASSEALEVAKKNLSCNVFLILAR